MAKNTEQELNRKAQLSAARSEIERRYKNFLKNDNRENSFESAEAFVIRHLNIDDLESIKVGNNLYEKGKLMIKLSGCDYPPHYH